jgi:ethanolamine ammonia-lyase small subunit
MTAPSPLWRDLRRFTPARVALGRTGNGLPTAAHLAFQAAHALARDAVHAELNTETLLRSLHDAGLTGITVRSACQDRRHYLLRPDLGRRLADEDGGRLSAMAAPGTLAFLVCDGLSAVAVQSHAVPLLQATIRRLTDAGITVAPVIVVASQGRVALGDNVGQALRAEAIAVLIGERPGLSAPDSMGVYLTWQPRPGRTDAERNCISNIRPDGLPIPAAADKLLWLINQMRRIRATGIELKDEQRIGTEMPISLPG